MLYLPTLILEVVALNAHQAARIKLIVIFRKDHQIELTGISSYYV